MNKHASPAPDVHTLATDARELLSATVDVAGEKIGETRRRMAAALEKVKAGAQAADKTVHQHPYKAIIIAAGAGLLLGAIIAGRCSKKSAPQN